MSFQPESHDVGENINESCKTYIVFGMKDMITPFELCKVFSGGIWPRFSRNTISGFLGWNKSFSKFDLCFHWSVLVRWSAHFWADLLSWNKGCNQDIKHEQIFVLFNYLGFRKTPWLYFWINDKRRYAMSWAEFIVAVQHLGRVPWSSLQQSFYVTWTNWARKVCNLDMSAMFMSMSGRGWGGGWSWRRRRWKKIIRIGG